MRRGAGPEGGREGRGVTRIVVEPARLRGGRTGFTPAARCAMPTCRALLDPWLRVGVDQGARRWAFCSLGCLAGYIRLCSARDAALEEDL